MNKKISFQEFLILCDVLNVKYVGFQANTVTNFKLSKLRDESPYIRFQCSSSWFNDVSLLPIEKLKEISIDLPLEEVHYEHKDHRRDFRCGPYTFMLDFTVVRECLQKEKDYYESKVKLANENLELVDKIKQYHSEKQTTITEKEVLY